MIAPRADEAIAKSPDWTTTRPRISQTLRTSSTVWASSARVTAQVPIEDQRYSVRRSTTSAIAPP